MFGALIVSSRQRCFLEEKSLGRFGFAHFFSSGSDYFPLTVDSNDELAHLFFFRVGPFFPAPVTSLLTPTTSCTMFYSKTDLAVDSHHVFDHFFSSVWDNSKPGCLRCPHLK